MNKINQVNFFKTNRPEIIQGNISIDSPSNVKSFKNVVMDMMSEMNEITNKPNQVTQDLMLGKADIHDAMVAIAESEMTVQAASTITGKILQTYEKIMQIQI